MKKHKYAVAYCEKGSSITIIKSFSLTSMIRETWQDVQERLIFTLLAKKKVLKKIEYKGLVFIVPTQYIVPLILRKFSNLKDIELKLSFQFIKKLPENWRVVAPIPNKRYFSESNDVDPDYVGDVVELQFNINGVN